MHNQKMLADSASQAAATVRSDSSLLRSFISRVNAPEYPAAIAHAVAHPESSEAKQLARQFAPLIMLSGSRVPFSPLERGTKAATELIALTRFFGYGNAFWTVGPDEKRNVIVARMSFKHDLVEPDVTAAATSTAPAVAPNSFPSTTNYAADSAAAYWQPGVSVASFSQAAAPGTVQYQLNSVENQRIHSWEVAVSSAIMQDPVAVAFACQRMVAALEERLFGVRRKRRRTTPQFSSTERGVLGRPQAWFHVTEVNGR
jgi:hypothetical protein